MAHAKFAGKLISAILKKINFFTHLDKTTIKPMGADRTTTRSG